MSSISCTGVHIAGVACNQPHRQDYSHNQGQPTIITSVYYNYIVLTLPRSRNGSTTNVQAGSKLLKHRGREALGEDIGVLRCRRDMKNPNVSEGDSLLNKMEINLNMLRALMLYWVCGEVDSTNVTTIDQRGSARWVAKLHE